MKNNFIILFLLLISFGLLFNSCNSTKYVPTGEFLLDKNKVTIDDETKSDEDVKDYLIQRPNQTIFGVPFALHFYNMGNINHEEDYKEWERTHPKTYNTLKDVFSEKQTLVIENTYNSLNKWYLSKGQAPVIYDNKKTQNTLKQLRTYYFNQGYFDATISYNTSTERKKATVEYKVTKNEPYYLDSIITNIDSKIIDSIYKKKNDKSYLKTGDRYEDTNFRKEAARLTNTFRNSGIYHFSKNLIGFYEIDTSNVNHKTDVILKITNRLSEKDGKITTHPLKVQKIQSVDIYTDYSYNRKDDPYLDTIHYKGFTIYGHDKIKYRPKALLNSIFIEPNQVYKDSIRNLTRRQLKALSNFRNVEIKYTEVNDSILKTAIVLTPQKKYAISLDTEAIHSNIKQIGFSGGFSFTNKNTFKGAEIFKLSFIGSIFDLANKTEANYSPFNSWEVGVDASIEVPRLALPFNINNLVPKEMGPRSFATLGTSFQKNIGLDKQIFTASAGFSWKSNRKNSHTIEVFNLQYVKNLNPDEYFYIYTSEYDDLEEIQQEYFPDENLTEENAIDFINENIDEEFAATDPDAYQVAKNIENRYYIVTTNVVVPSISYAYTYSTRENLRDKNYIFFRAKVIAAGNLSTVLSKQETAEGIKTFLDIPIAQFIRTDFEFKKFWETSETTVLAMRNFLGIAIPYGNSPAIPYNNSYFIGGSSDIRAWRTYELGPGARNTGLTYNVGNFKFITSLEYRFDITRNVKGALFADTGNIWLIDSSDLTPEEETLSSFKSLTNIALGSGFGIRYDFNFLVLRLDFAFKTYEPYLSGNRWLANYNFAHSVVNFGINYPF